MSERTKTKDALLICKGHYNTDLYECPLDALKAYQARETMSKLKYISDEDVIKFTLLETAQEFFTPYDWGNMFSEYIMGDIWKADSGLMVKIYPNKKISLSYEYICNTFIKKLSLLKVKDSSRGEIYIDLSAYENDKIII